MLHKHTELGRTDTEKRHGVAAIQRQQLFLKTTAEAEHNKTLSHLEHRLAGESFNTSNKQYTGT